MIEKRIEDVPASIAAIRAASQVSQLELRKDRVPPWSQVDLKAGGVGT